MLKEHLNTISEHLLSARAIRPVAPMNVRPGHWCERACQAELRAKAPSGDPAGNAAATEELRRYHLQRLTAALSGMTAESAAEEAARDIHALLGTATWTDISAGDPYRFDPSGIDAAFARTACALATALNVLRKPLSAISAALPAKASASMAVRPVGSVRMVGAVVLLMVLAVSLPGTATRVTASWNEDLLKEVIPLGRYTRERELQRANAFSPIDCTISSPKFTLASFLQPLNAPAPISNFNVSPSEDLKETPERFTQSLNA